MSEIVPEVTLVKARKDGILMLSPLKAEVESLSVKTADDYVAADSILTRIRTASKNWLNRVNPIIEPIRSGLDLLYGLRKDVIDPLNEMEAKVKGQMTQFKCEEMRQIQEAARERQREQDRIQAEIRAKEEKEAAAKTKQAREKLAQQRVELEKQASKVVDTPAPVKVAGSATRTRSKPLINDISKFLVAVVDGTIPEDCLTINLTALSNYYKADPIDVAGWPGVLIVEEVIIAGRG